LGSCYIDNLRVECLDDPEDCPDGYSIICVCYKWTQDVVDAGLVSKKTGKWIRKTVEAPNDDYKYLDTPYPDPKYGEGWSMFLTYVDGEWQGYRPEKN